MSKNKTKQFSCSSCGAIYPKWMGQCAACNSWDTVAEQDIVSPPKGPQGRQGYAGARASRLMLLDDVDAVDLIRIPTGLTEFDRVLGGGLASGSSLLIAGSPGAGKSTLLLQTGCNISKTRKVAYFSGEESTSQIRDRKTRLGLGRDNLLIATETNVTTIVNEIEIARPDVVIVDSIQTMYHPDIESIAGNFGQVKGCAAYLNQVAKSLGIIVIFVGHINKEENIAGPKALEHIVDCILVLNSNEDARYRILRAEKNRFGSISEVGVFAMTANGLKVVENPSAVFLSRAVANAPGVIVTPLWEGTRPLLVELQALADQTTANNVRRVSVGIDDRRLIMLLAVLHKHIQIQIHDKDVYVNVVGGIRITETSGDLPLLLTVASSILEKVIPPDTIAFGEVGLSGEVRPVQNGQDRIRESAKLGFAKAIVPIANCPKEGIPGIELVPVSTLEQAINWLNEL